MAGVGEVRKNNFRDFVTSHEIVQRYPTPSQRLVREKIVRLFAKSGLDRIINKGWIVSHNYESDCIEICVYAESKGWTGL